MEGIRGRGIPSLLHQLPKSRSPPGEAASVLSLYLSPFLKLFFQRLGLLKWHLVFPSFQSFFPISLQREGGCAAAAVQNRDKSQKMPEFLISCKSTGHKPSRFPFLCHSCLHFSVNPTKREQWDNTFILRLKYNSKRNLSWTLDNAVEHQRASASPHLHLHSFLILIPTMNTDNKSELYELMSYFTAFSNMKGATPEMASSLGPPARKQHCSYLGWPEMEVLGSVLSCQAWICWAEMAEGPLSSAGHHGCVTESWTAPPHHSGLAFAFLPGQQNRAALISPQRSSLETCCQHHSLFQASFPSLPCCRATATFAFVLFSHVTKTRRAAVMDRTGPALAGF